MSSVALRQCHGITVRIADRIELQQLRLPYLCVKYCHRISHFWLSEPPAQQAAAATQQQRAATEAAAAAAAQQRAAEEAAAAARGLTAAAVAPGGSPCEVSAEYVCRCTGGFASRALGEGAFGRVILGVDQGLGLRFAVKVLEQVVGGVPRALQSAQREIEARRGA